MTGSRSRVSVISDPSAVSGSGEGETEEEGANLLDVGEGAGDRRTKDPR